MSKWKKILIIILRILASMKLSSLVPIGRKQRAVSKISRAVASPPPLGGTRGAAPPKSVSAPAVVTFGPNSFERLPRSRVLSLLRSESLLSQRKIKLLVLHCSDTRPNQDFTIEKLAACHRARGFGEYPGYHIYIRRDGTCYYTRPLRLKGCHVKGYNAVSIGVCYEGGHSDSPEYKYEDNRTAEQMVVLDEVLRLLHECFPEARIVGHHELNPNKACPCLDVGREYAYIAPL